MNANFYTQLYFVVFIVLGAFFILNLFIGVIIDNFNRLKQQYEDGVGIFLTPGQRNWVNTLKSAAGKKPTRRLTRPTVCTSIPYPLYPPQLETKAFMPIDPCSRFFLVLSSKHH